MGGRTVWAQLTAWRRERAERALARMGLAHAHHDFVAILTSPSSTSTERLAAACDAQDWRRLRNAAKRARRAIRAAGGQA